MTVKSGTWVWSKEYEMLVPKDQYLRGQHNYFNELRSELPSPAVHAGGMPTIKSMADGRMYETKRNYYKSVQRAGCEIIGHDKNWTDHVKPPQPYGGEKAHEADLVRDVKKAIEIEQSKVPSYGPESRRLMRKQRRRERATK